jgi:hypothetical protein
MFSAAWTSYKAPGSYRCLFCIYGVLLFSALDFKFTLTMGANFEDHSIPKNQVFDISNDKYEFRTAL